MPAALALAVPVAVILVALAIRSALRSSLGHLAIAGVLALLLVFCVYRIWQGGFFTISIVRFILLFADGVAVLLDAVTILSGYPPQHPWSLGVAGLCLLAAGLLLARRAVRDWAASLVLFRPT
ncbi:hypothetical protein [Micromonospora vulcania]|uniref:Uncharacterized protein n=1 Tax=Micromonospora vulcania TaxID=1441873 RepID=A0ABW1H2U3_9ACTN